MKRSLISSTSCVTILSTIGTGAFAGDLSPGLADPVVTPPVECVGAQSLDLRAGVLRSDNVWADDIATFDDIFDGNGANLTDKLGLGDAEGGFGAGQFTWDRCGSDISVGAGFASISMGEAIEGDADLGNVAVSDDVDFQFFDAEYGRPIGDMARGFLGLRALNFESNSAISSSREFGEDSIVSATSFTGIGPRAGAEFNTSTRQSGSFGLFGGASAALLYGERKNEVEGSFYSSATDSASETSKETVLNFEAELGVSYNITEAAAVKLGMNYMQINGMDWTSGSDFAADIYDDETFNALEAGDRSFVGTFVGLEIAF